MEIRSLTTKIAALRHAKAFGTGLRSLALPAGRDPRSRAPGVARETILNSPHWRLRWDADPRARPGYFTRNASGTHLADRPATLLCGKNIPLQIIWRARFILIVQPAP